MSKRRRKASRSRPIASRPAGGRCFVGPITIHVAKPGSVEAFLLALVEGTSAAPHAAPEA